MHFDTNPNMHFDTNPNMHFTTNPNMHFDTNPYTNSNSNPYTNSYINSNTNPNTNPYINPYTNPYTNSYINSNSNINWYIDKRKIPIYESESKKDDDYIQYIIKMLNELFIENTPIIHEENINIIEGKSFDIIDEENIIEIVKPALKSLLEKFDPIDMDQYYDFTNTLMYKHLIYDDHVDTLSLGKQLINQIKSALYKLQEPLQFDSGTKLLEQTNLFDFINFKIVGGYIEISNRFADNNFRVITKDIIPNLTILSNQYDKPIDFNLLSNIILQNKTNKDIKLNIDTLNESLKILSQEYIICFQPRVELLIWTICRLIIAWYSDPILYENIFKMKILINLFRARGVKEFNKDIGVQPVIMIIPKYGKKIALKVLSHLSYFFFPYKKLGWTNSSPSYFNKLDNLIYYTNGSIELKKYIKFLIKSKSKFNNPLNNDFTKINIKDYNNELEYTMP